MIGLALSGGGSRAMAFHLGCLRALNDLSVLQQISVLSTISGGSVIGAYYAYTPQKSFAEFEADIRQILRVGLQHSIAWRLLQPSSLLGYATQQCQQAFTSVGARIAGRIHIPAPRRNRTDRFYEVLRQKVFDDVQLEAPRRHDMEVVVGACELRTGTAFRFSNKAIGGWRYGQALDATRDVAFAVAASAAYPFFLRCLDRTWTFSKAGAETQKRILLTDGGVYDNLGISVLEPGRSADITVHRYDCEHLIICSAGIGQEDGTSVPTAFLPRVNQAMSTIHRRVQDLAMQKLHGLKEAGKIKSFALPYLGQQDHRLPIRPPDLMPRSAVIGYGTNFAPMADEWINKLSRRGEQLTRVLIPYYMPDICT